MNSKALLLTAIIATADAYMWGTNVPSTHQVKRDLLTERVAFMTTDEHLQMRHPSTNVFHDLLESSQYCRWNDESTSLDERIEMGSLANHCSSSVTLPSPILEYCALQVITAGL